MLENKKLKAIEEIEGTNKTEKDKKEMAHINGLFCGLHILQNMATSALNGMKTFEKANNVSNPNSIYEGNSVCNEFIYEVTKSFIEMSGCQKSGDAADFNDYLSLLNVKNHLVTFLHNRFNILFVDGGAVFYHRSHIEIYLSSGRSSKNNKLLSSVKNFISNKVLLAECRALGMISKLVTGPLWRLLENPDISFFGMNDFWTLLVEKVSEFSGDASSLLLGQKVFQEDNIEEKDVYKCLFEKSDLDDLTVSALQHLCTTILPMLQRQLCDQLPGGTLFVPNADLAQNTVLRKTNRISETDFSALDRVDRKAPQKCRSAKSGMITYTVNKTGSFLSKLSKDNRKRYFDIARKVAVKRQIKDKQKRKEVSGERLRLQNLRIQKKERRQERQVQYLQKLNDQMKQEGVWVSENEADDKIHGKTNAKQRLLIRNQIIFHSKLLGSQIPNKSLLKFQEKNEMFGTEKLLANLKAIIVYNFSEGVPQNITEINNNVCKVMNASRKRKTRKTDVFPVKKVPKVFEIDKLYAIALTDRWYPGRCIQIVDENTAVVDFMTPSGNYFKWPPKNDVQTVYTDGALSELTVEPVSNGRLWSVVEKKEIDRIYKK